MTRPTQHPAPNSTARKRREEREVMPDVARLRALLDAADEAGQREWALTHGGGLLDKLERAETEVADRDRLIEHHAAEATRQLYDLKQAEARLAAVEALHKPIRVYDECDHDECTADQIDVWDYTACTDSQIGWACETCCYDDEHPIESCPHGADHRGVVEADSCPTRAALAGRGEAGERDD